MKNKAFSLIELMVVIAIIAIVAMVAVPNLTRYLAKAKRSEAYTNLNTIYTAQKVYWSETGRYSDALSGPNGIGWKPEGYKGGGANESFRYTYGFGHGTEGVNYYTGNLSTSHGSLGRGYADERGFVAVAAGDIDADGKPDILTVDETGTIRIVEDDLAE